MIWNYPHKPRQSLSSQPSYCSNLLTAGIIGMNHRTQIAQLILFNVLLESGVHLLYQPGHRRGGTEDQVLAWTLNFLEMQVLWAREEDNVLGCVTRFFSEDVTLF